MKLRVRDTHTQLTTRISDHSYSSPKVAYEPRGGIIEPSSHQATTLNHGNYSFSRWTFQRSSHPATIISSYQQYVSSWQFFCPGVDGSPYPLDLLRVIRKGSAVKAAVDDAIDQCAEVFNLRDSIEEARIRAEQVTDERQKRSFAQRGLLGPYLQTDISLIVLEGLQNLRRYFELIVFQAYLQSTEPDTLQTYQTFEAFVKSLPGRKRARVPGLSCV